MRKNINNEAVETKEVKAKGKFGRPEGKPVGNEYYRGFMHGAFVAMVIFLGGVSIGSIFMYYVLVTIR